MTNKKKNQSILDRTELEVSESINKYEQRVFLQRIPLGDVTISSGLLSGFNKADNFLEEVKSTLIAVRLSNGEDSEIIGFIEGEIIGFENLIRKHKYNYADISYMVEEYIGLDSDTVESLIGNDEIDGLFTKKYGKGSNSNILWLKEIYICPEHRRNWISKMVMYSLKKAIKDLYRVQVDWVIISDYNFEKGYLKGYNCLGFKQETDVLCDEDIENIILNLGFISNKGSSYNLNNTDFYYTYLPSVPDLSEIEFIDFTEKELLMLNFFLTTYQSIEYFQRAFFGKCEYCKEMSSFIDFNMKNGLTEGLYVNSFDTHMLMFILCDLQSCVFIKGSTKINISKKLKSALNQHGLDTNSINDMIEELKNKIGESEVFGNNAKTFFKNTILLTGKDVEEEMEYGALFINNLNIRNLRVISNAIKWRVLKELTE